MDSTRQLLSTTRAADSIEGPLGRAHRRPSIFDRAQRYSRAKEKQAVQNRRQERGRHRRRGARFFKKDDKSNAKLRTVMHNACISAINKREKGHRMATSTAFGNRVARCMGGWVCIQKDSERKPYNFFTVIRETQYSKLNAIISYCGYRRLYLHIDNVRISHAYHIKMCTWGMQERQLAQFWAKGLRFYTRYS